MPVDRNYPRVDGTLALSRLRVAEVKTAQERAHKPAEREPHATVLTEGRPQHVAPPVKHAAQARAHEVSAAPPRTASTLGDAKPATPPSRIASTLGDAKPANPPPRPPLAPVASAPKPASASSRVASTLGDAKPATAAPRPPAAPTAPTLTGSLARGRVGTLGDAKPTSPPPRPAGAPTLKPATPSPRVASTLGDAKPATAAPRTASIDPQRLADRAHTSTLPVSMPRVTAPAAPTGGGPSSAAPEVTPHQSVLQGVEQHDVPARDMSRIVWRDTLATR